MNILFLLFRLEQKGNIRTEPKVVIYMTIFQSIFIIWWLFFSFTILEKERDECDDHQRRHFSSSHRSIQASQANQIQASSFVHAILRWNATLQITILFKLWFVWRVETFRRGWPDQSRPNTIATIIFNNGNNSGRLFLLAGRAGAEETYCY